MAVWLMMYCVQEVLPEEIVNFKKAFEERPLVAEYLKNGRKSSA
jgi:hypothetical protein